MKRIYSSFNLAAVHHARNLLEAEGIRAVVRNELLSSAMGELPPAECQTELWVVRDSEAKSGPPWACASCGELCEPQFTQCWRCGRDRPA
ncbi:MAG: DUF2007 domain-containing protein [Betaproteobacteria bacterium]|nr:MAG: DUF2007 domain-containing protein [Betaproteobacteria bacterium]